MRHFITGCFLEELAIFFQTDLRTSHMFCPNLEPLFALCLLGYCRRWLCNMVEGRKGWPIDDWLQIACSKGRQRVFFFSALLYLCRTAFVLYFPLFYCLSVSQNKSFFMDVSVVVSLHFCFNIQSVSIELIFSFDDSLHNWAETCFKLHDWIKHTRLYWK